MSPRLAAAARVSGALGSLLRRGDLLGGLTLHEAVGRLLGRTRKPGDRSKEHREAVAAGAELYRKGASLVEASQGVCMSPSALLHGLRRWHPDVEIRPAGGHVKEPTDLEKARALAMIRNGWGTERIAQDTGVSRTMVERLRAECPAAPAPRPGRRPAAPEPATTPEIEPPIVARPGSSETPSEPSSPASAPPEVAKRTARKRRVAPDDEPLADRVERAARSYEGELRDLVAKALDIDASRVVVRCRVTPEGRSVRLNTAVEIDGKPIAGSQRRMVEAYLQDAFNGDSSASLEP